MPPHIKIEAREPQSILPGRYNIGDLVTPKTSTSPERFLKRFRYVGYGCLLGIGFSTLKLHVWTYNRAISIGTPPDGRIPSDEEVRRANVMLRELWGEDPSEVSDPYDME